MKKIAIIVAAVATVMLAACAGVQPTQQNFNDPAVVFKGQ